MSAATAEPASEEDAWRDETIRLGEEIFRRKVLPTLPPNPPDHVIVIDANGGGWEIDADEVAAHERFAARLPNARGYVRRLVSQPLWRMR